MNNLYVINRDDTSEPVDDTEVIDDSRPLEMDGSDGKKRPERRYHQRFQLEGDAFALIRSTFDGPVKIQGKSMGCIACAVFNAKPSRLGKIDNISMGGLMFQHVVGNTQIKNSFVLDILLADCRFYLANIPFKILSDVVIPEDVTDNSIEMRQVRLQFSSLNAIQQTRLKDFIADHGKQIVE